MSRAVERLLERIAKAFVMTDEVWARHANPLSGWTRMPILPLLALAIWARVWIGWACLVPIGALILWAWINPRAFPPPARADSWMSRAVHGERALLNAKAVPIPGHHAIASQWLTMLPVLGLVPLIWGLWALQTGWLVAGLALTMLPKFWFLDRMVWLYDEMCTTHPTYRAWMEPRKG